jgi:methylenetetrahydrofolate reductase (NADPH)
MKVTDHIQQATNTLLSFEILPPLKGKSIQSIYDHLDPLMEFKAFVDKCYLSQKRNCIQEKSRW